MSMTELASTYLTIEREIAVKENDTNDELLATSAVIRHALEATCTWVS